MTTASRSAGRHRADERTDHTSTGDGTSRGRAADNPREIPAKGWKDVLKRVRGEMQQHQTPLLAAGVAFWTFTSLFPALIAAITIYGLVVSPEEVSRRVEDLAGALPQEARSLLEEQLRGIASSSGGALGLGLATSLLGALWAASAGMSNLVNAVNAIYEEDDDRGLVKGKALALLLTVGAIGFLGLALAGIAGVPAVLGALGISGALKALLSLAVWPLLGALFVFALALLYRVAPDRDDAEWPWVTPGALVAMGLWVVASLAFQFYTSRFGGYQETYGALAAVVILLLWLMISSLCVLLGAHINAEMEAQTAHDTTVGSEEPMGQRQAYKADNLGDTAGDERRDPEDNQIDLREEPVR